MLLVSDKWQEYEIIYAGKGIKTERWGQYILKRPDPQIFWEMNEGSNIKLFAHNMACPRPLGSFCLIY